MRRSLPKALATLALILAGGLGGAGETWGKAPELTGLQDPPEWATHPIDYSGSVDEFTANILKVVAKRDKQTQGEMLIVLQGIYFMKEKRRGVAEPFAALNPEVDFPKLFGWLQDVAQQSNGEFSFKSIMQIYILLQTLGSGLVNCSFGGAQTGLRE